MCWVNLQAVNVDWPCAEVVVDGLFAPQEDTYYKEGEGGGDNSIAT
jgi:hypothetical protein